MIRHVINTRPATFSAARRAKTSVAVAALALGLIGGGVTTASAAQIPALFSLRPEYGLVAAIG